MVYYKLSFIHTRTDAVALAYRLTFLCITMKIYRVNLKPFEE